MSSGTLIQELPHSIRLGIQSRIKVLAHSPSSRNTDFRTQMPLSHLTYNYETIHNSGVQNLLKYRCKQGNLISVECKKHSPLQRNCMTTPKTRPSMKRPRLWCFGAETAISLQNHRAECCLTYLDFLAGIFLVNNLPFQLDCCRQLS